MHDERFVLGKYNLRMIFQWCFNLVSIADTMVDKQKKKKCVLQLRNVVS